MSNISGLFSEQQIKALSSEAPTPLYHQLYSLLKNAILNGSIDNGVQLPTEKELSQTFDVSRITAKRAMDELANEQLVERRRGKGTHVIYQYSPQPVKAPLVGMLQEIESMARHTTVRIIDCLDKTPPADVLAAMKLAEGQKVLHVVRVRSNKNEPFAYYSSWTQGLSKPVGRRQLNKSPRLEIFREQGLLINHVSQTISAVTADDKLAAELDTQVGAPLISLLRLSYTDKHEDTPVDYMQCYYHPGRFQYRMDLRLDE